MYPYTTVFYVDLFFSLDPECNECIVYVYAASINNFLNLLNLLKGMCTFILWIWKFHFLCEFCYLNQVPVQPTEL